MATKKVTEPAETPDAEVVTEPVTGRTAETVTEPNPTERVYVYNTKSGDKLPHPVPRTWLDGRFPHLKEQPSKKAGN